MTALEQFFKAESRRFGSQLASAPEGGSHLDSYFDQERKRVLGESKEKAKDKAKELGAEAAEEIGGLGANVQAPIPTKQRQIQEERKKAGEFFEGNPITEGLRDYVLEPTANFLDKLRFNNPVGKFVDRASQTGAETIGQPRIYEPVSTGSKASDFAADITGQAASFALLPGTVGPAGAGLVKSIYTNPLTQRAASYVGGKFSSPLAQKLAREATREGLAGAAIDPTIDLMRGQSQPSGLAKSAVTGGALGAAGGLAGPLLSTGAKAASRQVTENLLPLAKDTIKEAGERITGGLQSGIAPFMKKIEPKMDTKSQLTTRTKAEKTPLKDKLHQGYTKLVDDLHPLKRFDSFVEKVLGKQKPSATTYDPAINTRGADIVSNQILTDNLVDSSGKVVGKSLKESLEQLPKGAFSDFEDYLVNRHAITRAGRGERVYKKEINWTPDVGAEKIAAYEKKYPQFKEIAQNVTDFQKNMVNKWLVDSGLISKETAEQWFKENPYYVPNKREFTALEKRSGGTRAKGGFADQSSTVKKYSDTGSERPIISPIESMIENVDSFVKAGKRNQVMQNLIQTIQKAPEELAGWAEIVKQPEKAIDIRKIALDSEGGLEEVLARFTDDFDKSMKKMRLDRDNIIRGMVDGQPVHVKVNDPMLLDALTAMGPQGQNWLLDKLGNLTRVFKMLTTGVNPVFSLTRNIFRDVPQSYVQSKTAQNPVKFMGDLMSAFFDIAGNREAYQQFKNVGGGHSSPVAADRNLLAQSKRSILPREGGAKAVVPKAFNLMENFLNVIESGPRLAEFKRTGKATDDIVQALREAQEVSVNFKRRGSIGRQIDQVFPYFNAAMQGLDKLVRTFKDNPGKAFMKSFLALTVPTAALYAINRDDPNYQQLSDYVKDNFFVIPTGKGTFIRVAKPRELGTLFSDLPERMLQQMAEDDPEAFKRFADQVRTAFTVPGVEGATKKGSLTDKAVGVLGDTILGPFVDVAQNQNFMGASIVPGYLQNLPEELQYDQRTSAPSVALGKAFNTSPKELDYLAKSYGGVLGQLGIPLTQKGGGGALNRIGETLTRQVTSDPLYSNDIISDFYDTKAKLDEERQRLRQTGEVPEGYNDGLRKYLDSTAQKLSDLRKAVRQVQQNDQMDQDEKENQLRELQQIMIDLAKKANEVAKQ